MGEGSQSVDDDTHAHRQSIPPSSSWLAAAPVPSPMHTHTRGACAACQPFRIPPPRSKNKTQASHRQFGPWRVVCSCCVCFDRSKAPLAFRAADSRLDKSPLSPLVSMRSRRARHKLGPPPSHGYHASPPSFHRRTNTQKAPLADAAGLDTPQLRSPFPPRSIHPIPKATPNQAHVHTLVHKSSHPPPRPRSKINRPSFHLALFP